MKKKEKKEEDRKILPELYQKRLDEHDWHYAMSDDSRTYKRGLDEQLALETISASGKEYKILYDKKWKEIFRTPKPQKDGEEKQGKAV